MFYGINPDEARTVTQSLFELPFMSNNTLATGKSLFRYPKVKRRFLHLLPSTLNESQLGAAGLKFLVFLSLGVPHSYVCHLGILELGGLPQRHSFLCLFAIAVKMRSNLQKLNNRTATIELSLSVSPPPALRV